MLPACSGVAGVLALERAVVGVIGCGVLVVVGIAAWVWIAAGSDKFRSTVATTAR